MKDNIQAQRPDGFTLIELLVASYLDGHVNEHRWRHVPKRGRPFADRYADEADVADATWLIEQTPWYTDWLVQNWPPR